MKLPKAGEKKPSGEEWEKRKGLGDKKVNEAELRWKH